MSRPAANPLARAFAIVALLVLALGLPRLLTLCTHGCGHVHVELTSSHDECCSAHAEHDHAVRLGHEAEGDCLRDAGSACEHTSFGIELSTSRAWQLPRGLAQPGTTAWLPKAAAEYHDASQIPRLPPTTGPPRVDRRTERIVTTVLRC